MCACSTSTMPTSRWTRSSWMSTISTCSTSATGSSTATACWRASAAACVRSRARSAAWDAAGRRIPSSSTAPTARTTAAFWTRPPRALWTRTCPKTACGSAWACTPMWTNPCRSNAASTMPGRLRIRSAAATARPSAFTIPRCTRPSCTASACWRTSSRLWRAAASWSTSSPSMISGPKSPSWPALRPWSAGIIPSWA